MKQKADKNIKLFDGGKEAWEGTSEFKARISTVTKELRKELNVRLGHEKNWFKRQLIRIKFLIELKKKRDEISSMKNMHLASRWV